MGLRRLQRSVISQFFQGVAAAQDARQVDGHLALATLDRDRVCAFIPDDAALIINADAFSHGVPHVGLQILRLLKARLLRQSLTGVTRQKLPSGFF